MFRLCYAIDIAVAVLPGAILVCSGITIIEQLFIHFMEMISEHMSVRIEIYCCGLMGLQASRDTFCSLLF